MMKKEIPFKYAELQNSGVHIYVNAKINGFDNLLLLIDTGASNSVFDSNNPAFIDIETEQPDPENLASGFNSEIEKMSVGKIENVELEGIIVEIEPAVFTSLDHVNSVYAKLELGPLSGIIGCDFLKKYAAIIDFKKNTINLNTTPE
jgi:hypothetical protein